MALIIGTDSYVSLEDADAYIQSRYLSTDTQRIAWAALSADNKEIVLRNAAGAIQNIKVNGVKKDSEQILSFPRCYKNAYYYPIAWYEYDGTMDMHCQADVPDDIKHAQIHEALELASRSSDSKDYDIQTGPIKSVSMTGFAESYKTLSLEKAGTPQSELRSKKAQKLMSKYTGGGYGVR